MRFGLEYDLLYKLMTIENRYAGQFSGLHNGFVLAPNVQKLAREFVPSQFLLLNYLVISTNLLWTSSAFQWPLAPE